MTKIFSDLLNCHYELDFEQSNLQSFHKSFWFMMVNLAANWIWLQRDHQCWRSSKNDMTPTLWPWPCKAFFTWHWLTMMDFHNVWLQKVISFRRYHLGKKSITFWTFAVTLTLTLNTAKHTLHTTLDDCSSVTKVSAVQKVPSRQKIEFWTITVTLTFYTTIAHFQSMFWLMVVYQQTKFSGKKNKPLSVQKI